MDISVIIPTYKPGDYIWQCLDSLKDQTLAYDRYELIIIVNGCNEPYRSLIASHLAAWPEALKTSVMQTDQGGVSNARNIGLDMANGRYVCFIDDDDWVSPSYLEGLLNAVSGERGMVIANVLNYDEVRNEIVSDWLTECYERNARQSDKASLMSCRSFMSVACCKLTAREAIGDYRFDTHFKQGEDSLFNAVMSHRLTDFGVASPDVVYYRRLRQGSVSRTRALGSVFKDNFLQIVAFSKIYFKGIGKYNTLFFATRILACLKATFREIMRLCHEDRGS